MADFRIVARLGTHVARYRITSDRQDAARLMSEMMVDYPEAEITLTKDDSIVLSAGPHERMQMARTLSDIPQPEKDAIKIVDAFASAIAYATMFSEEACTLAANYIAGPAFLGEAPEVVHAFVKLLREGEPG